MVDDGGQSHYSYELFLVHVELQQYAYGSAFTFVCQSRLFPAKMKGMRLCEEYKWKVTVQYKSVHFPIPRFFRDRVCTKKVLIVCVKKRHIYDKFFMKLPG